MHYNTIKDGNKACANKVLGTKKFSAGIIERLWALLNKPLKRLCYHPFVLCRHCWFIRVLENQSLRDTGF